MADRHTLTQVVARFPLVTELLVLERPPLIGQRIADEAGRVWFVIEVLQCGLHTYTVRCAERRVLLDRLRESGDRPSSSALLAVVRRVETVPPKVGQPSRGLRRQEEWIDKYLETSYRNRHSAAEPNSAVAALASPRGEDRPRTAAASTARTTAALPA